MPTPPAQPKIYHIAHINKLSSVVADSRLWSDAKIAQKACTGTTIGMGSIKARRMVLPVSCHPGTCVGEFVPFYFCSRSIMLYVIYRANHAELDYRDGQEPVIHLEADMHRAVDWANAHGRRWAFSLSNASASYAQFRSNVRNLDDVNWPAVAARDFRLADVKEGKQAEFLMHEFFPWELIERIGVISKAVAQQVADVMAGAAHRPKVEIRRDWYY